MTLVLADSGTSTTLPSPPTSDSVTLPDTPPLGATGSDAEASAVRDTVTAAAREEGEGGAVGLAAAARVEAVLLPPKVQAVLAEVDRGPAQGYEWAEMCGISRYERSRKAWQQGLTHPQKLTLPHQLAAPAGLARLD